MKCLLLLFICYTLPYAQINLKSLDELKASVDSAVKERPKGLIIGRLTNPFAQKLVEQQTVKEAVHLTPPESLFGVTSLSPSSVYGSGSGQSYVTLREYDKDAALLEKRLDTDEQAVQELIGIVKKQSEENKRTKDYQSFILTLIEALTGLLGAMGTIYGYFRVKNSK